MNRKRNVSGLDVVRAIAFMSVVMMRRTRWVAEDGMEVVRRGAEQVNVGQAPSIPSFLRLNDSEKLSTALLQKANDTVRQQTIGIPYPRSNRTTSRTVGLLP